MTDQTKFCEIKQKKIHSLFSSAISLQDLVTKFNAGVSRMTGHVYRAARVWDTYNTNLASIKPGDLLQGEAPAPPPRHRACPQ